ncbi:hypothetical protein HG531_004462 [Fusarium graminearum]|nr:hypothetical protein HG531_004462 [Fusarium graminearum]
MDILFSNPYNRDRPTSVDRYHIRREGLVQTLKPNYTVMPFAIVLLFLFVATITLKGRKLFPKLDSLSTGTDNIVTQVGRKVHLSTDDINNTQASVTKAANDLLPKSHLLWDQYRGINALTTLPVAINDDSFLLITPGSLVPQSQHSRT